MWRNAWSPAATTTHQTISTWLLTLQEEGERQSSWCLALHPSLWLSFMQSRHFSHFSPLICSLSPSLNKCVLLFLLLFLSPPSDPSLPLPSFTLTLLPIQPEVNRDPLLHLACHSKTLSKAHLSKSTCELVFCTCRSDLTVCTHKVTFCCFLREVIGCFYGLCGWEERVVLLVSVVRWGKPFLSLPSHFL